MMSLCALTQALVFYQYYRCLCNGRQSPRAPMPTVWMIPTRFLAQERIPGKAISMKFNFTRIGCKWLTGAFGNGDLVRKSLPFQGQRMWSTSKSNQQAGNNNMKFKWGPSLSLRCIYLTRMYMCSPSGFTDPFAFCWSQKDYDCRREWP